MLQSDDSFLKKRELNVRANYDNDYDDYASAEEIIVITVIISQQRQHLNHITSSSDCDVQKDGGGGIDGVSVWADDFGVGSGVIVALPGR